MPASSTILGSLKVSHTSTHVLLEPGWGVLLDLQPPVRKLD